MSRVYLQELKQDLCVDVDSAGENKCCLSVAMGKNKGTKIYLIGKIFCEYGKW